jgi:hypothetical protein
MPVSAGQIKALLDQHRSAFSSFTRANAQLFKAYQQAWLDFSSLDLAGSSSGSGASPLPGGPLLWRWGTGLTRGLFPFLC